MRPASVSENAVPVSRVPTYWISASIGCARAFPTTSGPIPRGSPYVTARRTRRGGELIRSESDVDVGLPLELVDVMPDAKLIRQILTDFQFDVFVRQVSLT